MTATIMAINGVFVDKDKEAEDIWGEEKTNRFWEENFWSAKLNLEGVRDYLLSVGEKDISNDSLFTEIKGRKGEPDMSCRCGAWKWIDPKTRVPRVIFEGDVVYFSVNGTTSKAQIEKFIKEKEPAWLEKVGGGSE